MLSVIERASLLSLETYARERNALRARVIAHKKLRTVRLGEHVAVQFEDELLVRYQVQEMLRIERIYEAQGIQHELDTYNPMIPDGGNWKATMFVEYTNPDERREALARLKGVERTVWVQVEGCPRVYAIDDEDLERENEEKTSAVHFLRFELDAASREALRGGAAVSVGVDHPQYSATTRLEPAVRASLVEDLA